RVPGLLPVREAIADHALARVDVDRLRRPAFDCGDLARTPRQRAVDQFGDELPVGRGDVGLARSRGLTSSPVTQARRANQPAVSDAALPGCDSGDGLIGR